MQERNEAEGRKSSTTTWTSVQAVPAARAKKEFRSLMNVPFVTGQRGAGRANLSKRRKAAGFENLKGHRTVGGMRASIYNAMPMDGVEAAGAVHGQVRARERISSQ